MYIYKYIIIEKRYLKKAEWIQARINLKKFDNEKGDKIQQ